MSLWSSIYRTSMLATKATQSTAYSATPCKTKNSCLIFYQAGAMLFKLCRLQLCGIFLFLRFGGEIYHGRLGRLGRILPFSLAKFQVHLLLVDVAVHGVDELDAAFVLVVTYIFFRKFR